MKTRTDIPATGESKPIIPEQEELTPAEADLLISWWITIMDEQ